MMYIKPMLEQEQASLLESCLRREAERLTATANDGHYLRTYGAKESNRLLDDGDTVRSVAEAMNRYWRRLVQGKDFPVELDLRKRNDE